MRPLRWLRSTFGVVGRLGLVLWFVVPLVPMLLWVFANRWPYPSVLPTELGTDGLHQAVTEGVASAMGRSLLLAAVVALVATPIGAAAARALTFGRVPAGRLVEVILLAPIAIPSFAVVMGLNIVLLRWRVPGLVGVMTILVVAAIPYTTYVMRVAYLGHDLGYEEEARTLGASPEAVRWRVHVPLVLPALTVSAFLAFLVGWSDYIVTLLVGGGQIVTLPMLLGATTTGTGNESVVAVMAVLCVLCPLLLFGAITPIRRRSQPTHSAEIDRPVAAAELVGSR